MRRPVLEWGHLRCERAGQTTGQRHENVAYAMARWPSFFSFFFFFFFFFAPEERW